MRIPGSCCIVVWPEISLKQSVDSACRDFRQVGGDACHVAGLGDTPIEDKLDMLLNANSLELRRRQILMPNGTPADDTHSVSLQLDAYGVRQVFSEGRAIGVLAPVAERNDGQCTPGYRLLVNIEGRQGRSPQGRATGNQRRGNEENAAGKPGSPSDRRAGIGARLAGDRARRSQCLRDPSADGSRALHGQLSSCAMSTGDTP